VVVVGVGVVVTGVVVAGGVVVGVVAVGSPTVTVTPVAGSVVGVVGVGVVVTGGVVTGVVVTGVVVTGVVVTGVVGVVTTGGVVTGGVVAGTVAVAPGIAPGWVGAAPVVGVAANKRRTKPAMPLSSLPIAPNSELSMVPRPPALAVVIGTAGGGAVVAAGERVVWSTGMVAVCAAAGTVGAVGVAVAVGNSGEPPVGPWFELTGKVIGSPPQWGRLIEW
jgi:hypothetical protein